MFNVSRKLENTKICIWKTLITKQVKNKTKICRRTYMWKNYNEKLKYKIMKKKIYLLMRISTRAQRRALKTFETERREEQNGT